METDSCLSDEDLALLVQDGSHDAFATLVRRHSAYLYRMVWRTYPDREEARDIVQDVFLTFWQQPKAYDSFQKASFRTWLTRVVINRAIDMHRKKKPVIDYDYLLQKPDDDTNQPLYKLEDYVRRIELEEAIQELPIQQKNALDLCFYEYMPQKQAAEILGVNIKALESLLMRAKKSLRLTLQDRQEDFL